MKKRPPFFLIFICGILLCFSCKQDSDTRSGLTSLSEVDTIDLATYNSWVEGWKVKGQGFTDTMLLEYFTMPLIDLQEFALEDKSEARFVLGMDTTLYPIEAHLMLVGVDSLGHTILPSPRTPNAKIYDFTRPCPRYCDDTK